MLCLRMKVERDDGDLKALPGDPRAVLHGPRLYPCRSDALVRGHVPSVWSGAVPFGAVYIHSFIHSERDERSYSSSFRRSNEPTSL